MKIVQEMKINKFIKNVSFEITRLDDIIYLHTEHILIRAKVNSIDFSPILKLMKLPENNESYRYNSPTKTIIKTSEIINNDSKIIKYFNNLEINDKISLTNLFEKRNNKIYELYYNLKKDNYIQLNEQYTQNINIKEIIDIKGNKYLVKFELYGNIDIIIAQVTYQKQDYNIYLSYNERN
jgi:hypothetical protein